MHDASERNYYAVMSSLIQIRNVPEDQRRVLKARAAARGQSLNSYLLGVLAREVARPSVAEVLDRAARRTERAKASALETVNTARSQRDAELRPRSSA